MELLTKIIEVDKISSNVPRSNFSEKKLTEIANNFIIAEGIINPPIVKQIGLRTYEIINGDLEYYVAVRAGEINPRKGENICVYIINDENEDSIKQQVKQLRKAEAPVVDSGSGNINEQKIMNRFDNFEKRFNNAVKEINEMKPGNQSSPDIIKRLELLEAGQKEILNRIPEPPPPPPLLKVNIENEEVLKTLLSKVDLIGPKIIAPLLSNIIQSRPFNSESELMSKVEKFHTKNGRESKIFKNFKTKYGLDFSAS